MSNSRLKCRVLVDFDGTIATTDTTDLLLEQFAEPGWLAIEEDWMAGRIGSRECMLRQIDLVRATPQEMDAFVSSIEIDPGFHAFVALCRDHGHDVQVVSDGLDRTVRAVLRRQGLDLPFAANHLEWVGEDRWRLAFPHARGDCRGLAGNCKCQFAVAPPGMVRVVVGDGRSDFCVAEAADLVLAKASLRKHCQDTGRPHFAFETFAEATTLYGAWLKENQNEAPDGADELRDE